MPKTPMLPTITNALINEKIGTQVQQIIHIISTYRSLTLRAVMNRVLPKFPKLKILKLNCCHRQLTLVKSSSYSVKFCAKSASLLSPLFVFVLAGVQPFGDVSA